MLTSRSIRHACGFVCLMFLVSACVLGSGPKPRPDAATEMPEDNGKLAHAEERSTGSAELGTQGGSPQPAYSCSKEEGPFTDLLLLAPEKFENRLGKPTKTNQEKDLLRWDYDSLGLTVYIQNQMVFSMTQTKGRITQSLCIGDTEEQAVSVAGPLENGLAPGTKVGRVYQDRIDIMVTIQQGKIVKAQIRGAGGDN